MFLVDSSLFCFCLQYSSIFANSQWQQPHVQNCRRYSFGFARSMTDNDLWQSRLLLRIQDIIICRKINKAFRCQMYGGIETNNKIVWKNMCVMVVKCNVRCGYNQLAMVCPWYTSGQEVLNEEKVICGDSVCVISCLACIEQSLIFCPSHDFSLTLWSTKFRLNEHVLKGLY